MKKKIVPLILTASLCCGFLSGCQSSQLRSYTKDQKSGESTQTAAGASLKDYTACYNYYDADEAMLTVDGIKVTWGELFYWYVYDVSNMEQYYGEVTDWDAKSAADETKTNKQYVMDSALDTIKHYCAVQSKAKEKGVSLTDEDKATLQNTWETNVKNYGGGDEKAFIEYLKKAYLTKDMYDHINEVNLLYNRMLDTMYGTNGEKLSEDEILKKAGTLGYVRAKNLLILTSDDSGNKLSDDQLAEKKALADKLDKELKGITDKAQLEKRFDELTAQYGGDPGTQYYPDGYTFIPGKGNMDTTFESAVTATGEYQVSGVVETSYGYHIVLRLPLSASAPVEIGSDNTVEKLGYYVAQDLFNAEAETWANDAKVEYTKTYKKINLAKIFSKAKAASTASASPSPSAAANSPAASAQASASPAA